MNTRDEQILKDKLSSEFASLKQYQPDIKQDAVFQENLEKNLAIVEHSNSKYGHRWFAAAMLILSIGFGTVLTQYFSSQDINRDSISKLITATNKVESELSNFDPNDISTVQYIEAIRVREDLAELDKRLNSYYQSNGSASVKDLKLLWEKRLKMTQDLKAIYLNQYKVARI